MWDHIDRPESIEEPSDEQSMECTVAVVMDHDYASVPDPAAMDMVMTENLQLKEQIRLMSIEMKELKIQATFALQSFVGSEDDIYFYTGQVQMLLKFLLIFRL